MKRSTLWLLLSLATLFLLCPQRGQAQNTGTNQARSEIVMSELLEEVRMLRQEVRRLSAGTLRAQALLERLRIQQGQVNRLTVDLNKLRTDLMAIRTQRADIKGKLGVCSRSTTWA